MRERPILFKGAMVRAILAGQKTQTRRAVKPAPPAGHSWAGWCGYSTAPADEGKAVWSVGDGPLMIEPHRVACPFGQPGDRLWVRETFLPDPESDHDAWDGHTDTFVSWSGCGSRVNGVPPALRSSKHCIYRADWTGPDLVWRPSIHMPRWACRIVLEITAVRVERLQAISARDCQAEGIRSDAGGGFHVEDGTHYSAHPDESFASLWTSTGGDWDSNPWVWVIEFKRAEVQP